MSDTPVPAQADDDSLREQLTVHIDRARATITASPELLRSGIAEQLDRTRSLLTEGDPEAAAEQVLARLGGSLEIEQRIALEMTTPVVLANAEDFPAAHRQAIRALEILDRDGTREPPLPRLGPFTPIFAIGVEFVAEYIVKSYAETVATRLRDLYVRREAESAPGSPERPLYRQARVEMQRIAPGFNGGGLGAPLLLAGGVAAPVAATAARYFGAIDFGSRGVMLGLLAIVFALLAVASSMLISGAAVAHQRSRLIMDDPLERLWEAIGRCGNPPKDDSVDIATVGILLTAIGWLGLPALAAALYFFV